MVSVRCRSLVGRAWFAIGPVVAMSFVFVLASSSSAVAARGCWTMPVSGVVVDGFREPACRWCAGNRGLEFSTDVGSPVRSAVAGSVSFSGSVAGRDHLVVAFHRPGFSERWRVTYAGARSDLTAGDRVEAGEVVAVTTGPFHFGLRIGERYVDPTRLLLVGHLRASLIAPGVPVPRVSLCPEAAGVFPGARR